MHQIGGDSLIIFDSGLQRLSIFDSNGVFVRAFRLEGIVAFPEFPLARGSIAASTRDLLPRGRLQTGVNRDSTTLVTFSMEGILLDTIGRFPAPETYLWVEGPNVMVVPYSYARTVVVAPFGEKFYVGWSDAFAIRAYAADGTLERVIRRASGLRAAPQAEIEALKEEALANARSENHRRELARIFNQMTVRETLPAFVDLVVDAEENLWVEAYRLMSENVSHWDVFDREGRWLGTVELPPNLKVYEIGTDYILGRSANALGVERVGLTELNVSRCGRFAPLPAYFGNSGSLGSSLCSDPSLEPEFVKRRPLSDMGSTTEQ